MNSNMDIELNSTSDNETIMKISRKLLQDISLSQAVSLAREGELSRAEELALSLIRESGIQVSTGELLAKVLAQQGKLIQAQNIWKQLMQLEPDNKRFLSALSECEYLLAAQGKTQFWNHAKKIILIVNLVIIVSLILLLTFYMSGVFVH